MLVRPLVGLVALACAARGAAALEATLDGVPVTVEAISLAGRPEAPGAGDLVAVSGVWIRLTDDGPLHLRTVQVRGGRLLTAGDPPRTVAAEVGWNDASGVVAALAGGAVRDLRGLSLRGMPPGAADLLAGIDPARCAVKLGGSVAVGKERAVPPLPVDLECLVFDFAMSGGSTDFGSLRALRGLRVCVAEAVLLGLPYDVVADLRALRVLRVSLAGGSPERLSGLTALRDLDLGWSEGLTDLGFVRSLPALRRLGIAGTDVLDLSPLAGHPALETLDVSNTRVEDLRPLADCPALVSVDATGSEVSRLPAAAPPRLAEIRAVAARVSSAEAAQFRAAAPRSVLFARWMDPLRAAVAEADLLRVREGGRSARGGRSLAEVSGPAEIRALLEEVRIFEWRAPGEWGGHCTCDGDLTLEFRCGPRVLAEVSVHGGARLRWSGWPSDAVLTAEGTVRVRRWLVRHGAEKDDRAWSSADEYMERAWSLVPEAVRDAMAWTSDPRALRASVPDPGERVAALLRMFGCGDGPWALAPGYDGLIARDLLPAEEPDALLVALGRVVGDPCGERGAARWLLGLRQWARLPRAAIEPHLPALGAVGLASPAEINRRRTMTALRAIGTPAAASLLRQVLRGDLLPRPRPAAEEAEPPGPWEALTGDDFLRRRCSDAAFAALCLGEMGCLDAVDEMEALLGRADPADRSTVLEALKRLRGGR